MVTECSIKGEFHYCPTVLVMCWGACVPVVQVKVLDRYGHNVMQCSKVVLSLQTLPPRADTESDWCCWTEWGWLARLLPSSLVPRPSHTCEEGLVFWATFLVPWGRRISDLRSPIGLQKT